jgi:hypothetical protein
MQLSPMVYNLNSSLGGLKFDSGYRVKGIYSWRSEFNQETGPLKFTPIDDI